MNTIIGFACAVGVDMGYNVHHHESEEMNQQEVMHSSPMHHHETSKQEHHHPTNKSTNDDDCCSHSVKDLTLLSKTVPNKVNIVQPVFFISFIGSYVNAEIFSYANIITNLHLFSRGHHPPIPDIRIAIRSFQI